MASQSRKYRGYESQKFVAEYFKEHGWPFAEPVGAGRAGSDVTGIVGVDVEVKAVRELSLTAMTRQQANRASDGILRVGVVRPDGYGEARIAEWPAILPLSELVKLMKEAGY